jgi:hypothetical protein
MALFSLTDIKYKSEQRQVNSSDLIGGPYSYELHRFPEDLGSVDKGHYMIFHISVSNLTNEAYTCSGLTKKSAGGISLGDVGNLLKDVGQGAKSMLVEKYGDKVFAPLVSALNSFNGVLNNNFPNATGVVTSGVKNGIEIGAGALNQASGITVGEDLDRINMTRKTTQIKDTIALYMPNTLAFTQSQSFSSVSRNDTVTNLLVGKSLIQQAGTNEAMGSALAGFVAGRFGKELGSLTNSPGTVQLALAGTFGIENPRIEILYTKPEFRQLRYDFMFYPRSSAEAKIVQTIIRLFKYHQSPEIKRGTQGQFLVPPSEFDIEFFYNGRVNMNVPKVKSCVLSSVDVDYAPNGFRAYESFDKSKPNFLDPSLGGTGMPVAIRMSLSFQETEYFSKDDYRNEDNV